jgi:hypothetical protein
LKFRSATVLCYPLSESTEVRAVKRRAFITLLGGAADVATISAVAAEFAFVVDWPKPGELFKRGSHGKA